MQDSSQGLGLIEKWESEEENNEHNKILKTSKDFRGISKTRVCTDIFCLSVFIVLNAGLFGLSYYISLTGDINRLGHGSDFRGDVCGVEGLSSRKYTYYPDPSDLLISLCLKKCPNKIIPESICYYDTDYKTEIKTYTCWDSIETTEFGYICFPKSASPRKAILDEFFTKENLIRRSGGDIISVWPIGLFGVIISIIISIGFLISLAFPRSLFIFTIYSIIQNICLLPCIVLLIYYNSIVFKSQLCDKNNSIKPDYCYLTPEFGLIILTGFTGFLYILYIIYTVLYRKTTFKVVEIFKVVSEPINKVKRLVLIPVMLNLIGLLALIGLLTLMLYSFGIGYVVKHKNNDVPGGEVNRLEFRNWDRMIMSYIIFMCFWWLSFLIGLSEFIVGGVVGCWYFSKEKSALYHPISSSVKNCFRYHLGSIVRGAFYNLLFKVPGFVMMVAYRIMVRFKKNGFVKCWAVCCCPFMSCYHFGLKYSSSSSYIYLALFGLPYSQSSRQSYYLKQRNHKRTHDFLSIPWHCIFQMKIAIAVPGFLLVYSFLLLNQSDFLNISSDHLTSFLSPAVFSLLFCIFISEIVTSSLYSSVEAMSLCIAADEEMFTAEQRFVKDKAKDILDNSYSETRKAEFNPVDTQKPGRSNRMPVNLIEFDASFNAKVSPIPKAFSPSGNSGLYVMDY